MRYNYSLKKFIVFMTVSCITAYVFFNYQNIEDYILRNDKCIVRTRHIYNEDFDSLEFSIKNNANSVLGLVFTDSLGKAYTRSIPINAKDVICISIDVKKNNVFISNAEASTVIATLPKGSRFGRLSFDNYIVAANSSSDFPISLCRADVCDISTGNTMLIYGIIAELTGEP